MNVTLVISDPFTAMSQCLITIATVGALTGLIVGCTRNVIGGNPSLPLSNSNGVTRTFNVSDIAAATAVTNAFSDTRYRGMLLEDAQDYPGWHLTNGYILRPFFGPNWDKHPLASLGGAITNIPLDSGKTVPYAPFFSITVTPTVSNRTTVTVRTIVAQVTDGQETGVHGGWANHSRNVPPVRQEEQNVLNAIAQQLQTGTNVNVANGK